MSVQASHISFTKHARCGFCFLTVQLAYTFDAGPNAFLLTLSDDAPMVLALLRECFGEAVTKNGDTPVAKLPRLENQLEVTGIQYPANVDLTDLEVRHASYTKLSWLFSLWRMIVEQPVGRIFAVTAV